MSRNASAELIPAGTSSKPSASGSDDLVLRRIAAVTPVFQADINAAEQRLEKRIGDVEGRHDEDLDRLADRLKSLENRIH